MHDSFLNRVRVHRGFLATVGLVAVWITGVWAGYLLYRSSEHIFISLMCGSYRSFVSIVLLLAGVTLPFLITAYAVHYKQLYILYFLCFIKAFSYCIAVLATYGAYGAGGWLMHGLLLFTENVSVCLLLFLWLRWLWSGADLKRIIVPCGCFALLGWGLDMVVIAPFVVSFTSL